MRYPPVKGNGATDPGKRRRRDLKTTLEDDPAVDPLSRPTDALRNVTQMMESLAKAATAAALNPETPPTMLPQVLGTALRAALALEKVHEKAALPPSPPDERRPETIERPPDDSPGWLHMPATGHDELPSIMPDGLFGPPWSPFRDASPDMLERANNHLVARRVVWLREQAAELAALLCASDEIAQVELDLVWVRTGGAEDDIRDRWLRDWAAATPAPPQSLPPVGD